MPEPRLPPGPLLEAAIAEMLSERLADPEDLAEIGGRAGDPGAAGSRCGRALREQGDPNGRPALRTNVASPLQPVLVALPLPQHHALPGLVVALETKRSHYDLCGISVPKAAAAGPR